MAVTNELFMLGISILMYLVIAVTWDFELFKGKKDPGEEKKNNIMKTMIVWLILYLQPLVSQLSIDYATDYSRSANVLTLLTTYYQVTVWVLIVISVYFGIMFLYNVMLYLSNVFGDKK